MIKACMFFSLAANAILVVLLLATSQSAPPAIGDLLDNAAAQSCEGAKHLKEYDPRKHKKGTYVTEVDPLDASKLPGAVVTYKLMVRCSGKK